MTDETDFSAQYISELRAGWRDRGIEFAGVVTTVEDRTRCRFYLRGKSVDVWRASFGEHRGLLVWQTREPIARTRRFDRSTPMALTSWEHLEHLLEEHLPDHGIKPAVPVPAWIEVLTRVAS